MSLQFNATERDVLYYLFDKPTSTEKDIVRDVTVIDSKVAAKGVLKRLKMTGLLKITHDVLYQLTDLGKVLIGKLTPNPMLKNELARRGFDNIDSPMKRLNSYPWGSKASKVHVAATPAATPAASQKMTIRLESPPETSMASPAKEKVSPGKQPVSQVLLSGALKGFEPLCLTATESDIVSRVLTNGASVSVELTDEKALQSLCLRQIVSIEKAQVVPGLQMNLVKSGLAFLPNTVNYNLVRNERLLVEMMGSLTSRVAKMRQVRSAMKIHDDSLKDSDIEQLLEGLKKKGVTLTRSNKMFYLTAEFMAANLMGRYGKTVKAALLKLPTGKAIVKLAESSVAYKSLYVEQGVNKAALGENAPAPIEQSSIDFDKSTGQKDAPEVSSESSPEQDSKVAADKKVAEENANPSTGEGASETKEQSLEGDETVKDAVDTSSITAENENEELAMNDESKIKSSDVASQIDQEFNSLNLELNKKPLEGEINDAERKRDAALKIQEHLSALGVGSAADILSEIAADYGEIMKRQ